MNYTEACLRAAGPCSKCGLAHGRKITYYDERPQYGEEGLWWACNACGHAYGSLCSDAAPPTP